MLVPGRRVKTREGDLCRGVFIQVILSHDPAERERRSRRKRICVWRRWQDNLLGSVNLKRRRKGLDGSVRFYASAEDGRVHPTMQRKQEIESHGSQAMRVVALASVNWLDPASRFREQACGDPFCGQMAKDL